MKRQILSIIRQGGMPPCYALFLALAMAFLPAVASPAGAGSGGSGTSAAPYLISSAADLAQLATDVNGGETYANTYFQLTANIDLSGYGNWTPIGTANSFFEGTFDGAGHVIQNLTVNTSVPYAGLFGIIDSGGTVENLGVVGGDVTSSGSYVGGVVGYVTGMVTNCYNTGAVTGTGPGPAVGGVAGFNYSGTIQNCYNTGAVTAAGTTASYAGGMAGRNGSNGTIQNCYNTGAVTATGSTINIGGVTGYNGGTVTNCYYNNEKYTDTDTTPGVIGLTTVQMTDNATLTTGAMVDINGDNAFVKPDYTSGSNGCATAFYPELAVFATSSDPTGFTQTLSKISVATEAACTLGTNEQYFVQGDGTSAATAYQIWTAQQLNHVREHLDAGTYFKLMADIDLSGFASGTGWTPIGSNYYGGIVFAGNFDGGGHIITGLTINDPSDTASDGQGLFDNVIGGTVSNLGIEGASISGGDYTGGLAGSVENGSIANCYVTGTVSGGQYVGGVAGDVLNSSVTNCYSTGVVSGTNNGGVVGYFSSGSISNCYYNTDYTDTGIGYGTDTTTGLTTAQMVAAGTLTGDMSGLNTGSAFTKRLTDSFNCYYPELSVFYADPAATVAQIASKASVQVARRMPAVAPSATAITYGQTLAASTLSGSATDPVNSNAVAGAFAWADSTLVPAVGTTPYDYTFTPDFTDLYFSVNATAPVTVATAATAPVKEITLTLSATGGTYDNNSITLTATVGQGQAYKPAPTGTITFLEGDTILGTRTLNSYGTATFTIASPIDEGSYTFTAEYSGDATYNGVVSDPCIVDVTAFLSVSSPSLHFDASGGTQQLLLTCNSVWSLGNSASWLTTSVSDFKSDNPNILLNVTADANPDAIPRTALLTISVPGVMIKTVNVTQDAGVNPATALQATGTPSVIVYSQAGNAVVKSDTPIQSVAVYDVSGRLLKQVKEGGSQVTISGLPKQQVLIVKVTDGRSSIKNYKLKIMN